MGSTVSTSSDDHTGINISNGMFNEIIDKYGTGIHIDPNNFDVDNITITASCQNHMILDYLNKINEEIVMYMKEHGETSHIVLLLHPTITDVDGQSTSFGITYEKSFIITDIGINDEDIEIYLTDKKDRELNMKKYKHILVATSKSIAKIRDLIPVVIFSKYYKDNPGKISFGEANTLIYDYVDKVFLC